MTISKTARIAAVIFAAALLGAACTTQASNTEYFGKTEPPPGQELRYNSGSEPESLDPQFGSSQPDARIHMALFDGLAEYEPKTQQPIPALAERWTINADSTEFTFYLRKGAKFSNGDPITAKEFAYSFRRVLSPDLASRNGYLAYYIKYGQAYNQGDAFVRDPQTGKFLTEGDVSNEPAAGGGGEAAQPAEPASSSTTDAAPAVEKAPETDFYKYIHSPTRLTVPEDEKERAKLSDANPKLKALLAGKEFVPVKAEDIGVEAVDDYTFRITLVQSAPYFIGLIPHQAFRVVHPPTVERFKDRWTQPENIVVSGAFTLEAVRPYNEVVVRKNPMYWDAGVVKLNRIRFYPVQDNTTAMNLYKAGELDGLSNHRVPAAWHDVIHPLRDYMDAPENALEYYSYNCLQGPTTDKRVRRALNMAVDKVALAKWKRTAQPAYGITPMGIYPGYTNPKGDGFDPPAAKKLLAEAGYKDAAGNFDPKKFPVSEIELTYNPDGGNAATAEFVQAQWKQNLGITIPLKSLEFRTFLVSRARVQFKGVARNGWIGDYIDPYTFLALFDEGGESGTGWKNAKYSEMLSKANATLDPAKRFEALAKAEAFLLEEQPFLPLMGQTVNAMKKPYVRGMEPNPGTMHAWKYVWIEYDRAKWDPSSSNMND